MNPALTNLDQGSPESTPRTIEYAIIGYGACGGQFVGDLILERLILHWANKRASDQHQDVDYRLHVTIFSSQSSTEAGGGEAWSSDQDGCINSPIPGHPDMPGQEELPSTLHYRRLVALVTDMGRETSKDVWHDFDQYMDRFEADNKPGAALMWGRSQAKGSEFDTSRPCVPRRILGSVRKKGLDGIIEFAHKYFPSITVALKYETRAILHEIYNPVKPVVKYFPPEGPERTKVFDKVISFSGSRITSVVPKDLPQGLVHANPINNIAVKNYLRTRRCDDPSNPEKKVIGLGGAQLNFIDCASIVGTIRELFDFNKDEQPFCRPKSGSLKDRTEFIVFSRRAGGSVKPRLSFTQDWPHKSSYLATEHVLALRTQKAFDWVTTVNKIWESMISYVMKIHPNDFSSMHPTTMSAQWELYGKECKTFRENENNPTYCGLERVLIDALFHGYGAEPSVKEADRRMKQTFPAIFVSGKRMNNIFYAHVSSIAFLDAYGKSNAGIQAILREWYRTYSSSPVEICEPIFELYNKGVLKHKKGDVSKIKSPDGIKIIVPGEGGEEDSEVDALFAPGQFGKGIDDVLMGVLPQLEQQAPKPEQQAPKTGIPVWKPLGQLVNKDGKMVNVWDYGNNRGVGLAYKHFDKDGKELKSEVISRSAVNQLSATHEFPPSLAACLLAHDLYTIGKGHHKIAASERLQDAIEHKQPNFNDYSRQMKGLEQYYIESMKRFYFLEAIKTEETPKTWRKYYEQGLAENSRDDIISKMLRKGTPAQREAASTYQSNVKAIKRDAMGFAEWHAPFTDMEMREAWDILMGANSWYQKHQTA